MAVSAPVWVRVSDVAWSILAPQFNHRKTDIVWQAADRWKNPHEGFEPAPGAIDPLNRALVLSFNPCAIEMLIGP